MSRLLYNYIGIKKLNIFSREKRLKDLELQIVGFLGKHEEDNLNSSFYTIFWK